MSEYNELIKNYNKIRDYMRDFYIYGFRSRENFKEKSCRSYDNEKRRIESYMGDLIAFRQDEKGKKVFLTADTSDLYVNPFYKSFKIAITDSTIKKDITKNEFNLAYFKRLITLTQHRQEKDKYKNSVIFWRRFYLYNTLNLLKFLQINQGNDLLYELNKFYIEMQDEFSLDMTIHNFEKREHDVEFKRNN
jgi:hypothetical protein